VKGSRKYRKRRGKDIRKGEMSIKRGRDVGSEG